MLMLGISALQICEVHVVTVKDAAAALLLMLRPPTTKMNTNAIKWRSRRRRVRW